jgi:NADH-ubiquinone oxidoreductase chain 5
MYLTLLSLPLLSAVSSGLLGRKIGITGSYIITCSLITLTCLTSLILFYEVSLSNSFTYLDLFKWIDLELLDLNFGMIFDSLTSSMLLPVLMISSLVHIYSSSYMESDPHQQRFFSYLSLFTLTMIVLVTADNYVLLFVGWEGVGVCSYLLVSFWFTRIQANKSAINALLFNRVGDLSLTLAMFIIFISTGSLNFDIVYSISPFLNEIIVFVIGLFLLIAAMGKSAQIGLHVWLPYAMEGPTPVSALIHAATMVTAGAYLLMRSSPLLEYSSTILLLVLWIGAITTLFAGMIGLVQNDLKKVIAYSTCSQLGMLFIAIGLSQYHLALYHLVNHAFFKALLFLSAGSVIHAINDEQDQRRMGGLIRFIPFTYTMILIGSLSLMAIPFLTGYYSKDFIIESTLGRFFFSSTVVYYIATLSAICTSLYSLRLLYLTFLSEPQGSKASYSGSHEPSLIMGIPLMILAIFSIFFGYLAKDFFIGLGSISFNGSIFINPDNIIGVDTEFGVGTIYKLLPVILSIVFGSLLLLLYTLYDSYFISYGISKKGRTIYSLLNQRMYVELIINKFVIYKTLSLGYLSNTVLDRGLFTLIGPLGLDKMLSIQSVLITKGDNGSITKYSFYLFLSFIIYIVSLFFPFTTFFYLILTSILFLF